MKTKVNTIHFEDSKLKNCELCNEEVTVSPSSMHVEGKKHYVCFDCALPDLLENKDKILPPTEEQLSELREISKVRKQEMYN